MEDAELEVAEIFTQKEVPKYALPSGEVIKQFDRLLQDEEVKQIKNGEKVEPVLG